MENTNTTNTSKRDFEQVKRDFEQAYAAGGDYSAALLELSTAIAYSVVRKCLDPQAKTAPDRETVSDNAQSPAMLQLRRGIAFDRRTLDNTAAAADRATRITFTADGDAVTEVADKTAAAALAALVGETLSDGIDLVQEAAAALLEQPPTMPTAPAGLTAPLPSAALPGKSISGKRTARSIGTMKQPPPKRFTGLFVGPSATPPPSRLTPGTAIPIWTN